MSRVTTWRRWRWPVAPAVLALLLQSLAPLVILPPYGQPVHYAHSHGDADSAGGSRAAGGPDDLSACPVCHALQVAGAGIAAPPVVLLAGSAALLDALAPRADAPATELPSANRARAPPIRA